MNFENINGGFGVESIVTLNEVSPTAIAVASYQGAIHLAWTDANLHINTVWSSDGHTVSGKQTLEHQSFTRFRTGAPSGQDPSRTQSSINPVPPSMAGGSGGLLLAWVEARGNITPSLNAQWAGRTTVGPPISGQSTNERPAVAALGDEAALVWTGTDKQVNLAYSQSGAFGEPMQFGKTDLPPAVCTVGNELAVAWVESKLFRTQLNVVRSGGGQFGEPIICRGISGPVSMCGLGAELVVTWREHRHRRTNIGFLQGDSLVPAVCLPGGPMLLPVCAHGSGIVVAWPHEDGRINVAQLRRTA